ncbi:hypothetical protein [Mucilaginibacter flavidus]|uniref:hypothetical protein n=1 Tax=Mucilaginibacter flavidus TaxID=2949309 RepID=UPI00209238C4|nr:hypothetical protein [Mucilaginibacter flavidus]MCO5946633.1 hypothetical protein [Mucilaginibacter flavidus]
MKLNLFIIAIVLISCKLKPSPGYIITPGGESFTPTDTSGVLVGNIKFELKATKEEKEIFDDGIVPWVNIANPKKQLDSLISADEIVLSSPKATLIIDYPLTSKAIFVIESPNGFSRKQLILLISEKYHQIYKEEEDGATTKAIPVDQRGNELNRNQTNGKYGIWGHDITDLDLGSIDVRKSPDGEIFLELDIES